MKVKPSQGSLIIKLPLSPSLAAGIGNSYPGKASSVFPLEITDWRRVFPGSESPGNGLDEEFLETRSDSRASKKPRAAILQASAGL